MEKSEIAVFGGGSPQQSADACNGAGLFPKTTN
jgi:hypothetical protein